MAFKVYFKYFDGCVAEFNLADVVKVVEICRDSVVPFEKDVTEELRLRCKSLRGEGTGGHRPSSRDNVLMNFLGGSL